MAEKLARGGWDLDLAHGVAREGAFVEAIRQARVEHKSDGKTRSTGNVAFEIRQGSTEKGKGNPSGIATTEAEWWAVEFDDDRWLVMRTSLLKEVVREVYAKNGSVMGGDFNRYENVLVSLQRLVRPGIAGDSSGESRTQPKTGRGAAVD